MESLAALSLSWRSRSYFSRSDNDEPALKNPARR